jgi:ABC-type Fe3+-hydroxamate transport system substrate-binding protein
MLSAALSMTPNTSQASSNVSSSLCFFFATAAFTALHIRNCQKKKKKKKKFRIVSLCPSTTATLYDLGLAEYVVGRTTFCTDFGDCQIPTYGGTKNPQWDQIRDAAKPTHILFNMEENDHNHLFHAQMICHTLTDTPVTVQGSRDMVLHLGHIFGVPSKAAEIALAMDKALVDLQSIRSIRSSFTYLYFIWHKPAQRVVGGRTYIHAMLEAAGGINLAVSTISPTERYPLLPPDYDQVADYCFLSTEPFHFQKKHIGMYQRYGKLGTRIISGEMLSWHGSRTVEGLQYLIEYFSVDELAAQPNSI